MSAIKEDFEQQLDVIRRGEKTVYTKVKDIFRIAPGFVSKLILDFAGFVQYSLNLKSNILGLPEDAFGSVMVSNVGSMGIEMAYCPIAPYTRIPMVMSLGKIRKAPVVAEDGSVVADKIMTVCLTVDHRIMEASQYMGFRSTFLKYFKDPSTLEGFQLEKPAVIPQLEEAPNA